MSNTSLRLTTAAVLSCLASVALAAPQSAPGTGEETKADAGKVDECLSSPKGTTPPGGHWYYRLERGTKRKCWYLGDEGGKVKSAAKPVATASREMKSTSAEPPMQPKVANARAELTTPAAPSATVAEWPMEADAQLPARRAPQALASAAPDGAREAAAQNHPRGQELAQAPASQPDVNAAQSGNASPGAGASTAQPPAADLQSQAQPATAQPAAAPPVQIRTAVVRPVPSQPPATPQPTASAFNPFRIALGLLVVVIALATFMNRHLLQRLGRRYFGLHARHPQPRPRRDIWGPLDPDAERTTYEDMVAEPVELTDPPRWVRNVREFADAREHVDHPHTRAHQPSRQHAHHEAYDDRMPAYDHGPAHDETIEPHRSADELEDLLRRASQRPATRRDAVMPRELATPRVASAGRARTPTGPSGARA